MLHTDQPVNENVIEKLRKILVRVHARSENSGKTMILPDGFKFQPITFNSVDLQFQEMRRFQIQEISRAYRVPLVFLNDLERVTHKNGEELGRQFIAYSLLPWLTLWVQAIRRSLLRPDERSAFFAEFNTDELLKADLKARFEAYASAEMGSILSPNEIRAKENLPPYDGGDEFMKPLNMGTVGQEKNDG